jgi:hypothetical protein
MLGSTDVSSEGEALAVFEKIFSSTLRNIQIRREFGNINFLKPNHFLRAGNSPKHLNQRGDKKKEDGERHTSDASDAITLASES